MARTDTPPVDLTHLASRRNGRGYELMCPSCGRWVRRLLATDGGKVICERCLRKASNRRTRS